MSHGIGLWEFYHAFKEKGYQPIEVPGYLLCLTILGIGYLNNEKVKIFLFVVLPVLLFVLFLVSIFTNMKRNIIDIAISILGIIYVVFLFSFISFICVLNHGNYYIWYLFGGAWLTDTFAYFIGRAFGKHKFTQISPKKSIEGCIGGLLGAALFYIGYTYYLNTIGIELNVWIMAIIGIIVSVISQIGDLAASSIKRYCDIKDFGTIMPGHGGVLDRFDSVIMIAPFLFIFFQFFVA